MVRAGVPCLTRRLQETRPAAGWVSCNASKPPACFARSRHTPIVFLTAARGRPPKPLWLVASRLSCCKTLLMKKHCQVVAHLMAIRIQLQYPAQRHLGVVPVLALLK
jgi:hypothetical protein